GGQHGCGETYFKLCVAFLFPSGFFGESGESFAALDGVALPEKYEGLLALGVEFVVWIVRKLDGAVIFFSRAVEIAHESVGAAKTFLRRQVLGVNFESGGVVLE